MNIDAICDTILDVSSSPEELRFALDTFTQQCSEISDIQPDPSFDAWAEDSLLDSGVAINPNAAAHCALDYQRSVVFIRGVYAAIKTLKLRFPETPLELLYAGCGPFATAGDGPLDARDRLPRAPLGRGDSRTPAFVALRGAGPARTRPQRSPAG